MTRPQRLFAAFACVVFLVSACASKPAHKCTGYWQDARELGFCDLGPSQSRILYDKGLW